MGSPEFHVRPADRPGAVVSGSGLAASVLEGFGRAVGSEQVMDTVVKLDSVGRTYRRGDER